MNIRIKPSAPKGHDFGVDNGAGKGDAPRSCHSQEFRENFDRIHFAAPLPSEESFHRDHRGHLVKVYGRKNREVQPPDGYRLLVTGETIEEGDMFKSVRGETWQLSDRIGDLFTAFKFWPMARRLNEK